MPMWWGSGFGSGAVMMYGMLGMLVGLAMTLLLIMYFACLPGLGEKSAREILAERFARGEIDRDEYQRRKRLISGL
jgi:hypothetical protein